MRAACDRAASGDTDQAAIAPGSLAEAACALKSATRSYKKEVGDIAGGRCFARSTRDRIGLCAFYNRPEGVNAMLNCPKSHKVVGQLQFVPNKNG